MNAVDFWMSIRTGRARGGRSRGDVAGLMMMIVAGTYFSGRTIEKVAQVLRRR
jgi:hypothetical protein